MKTTTIGSSTKLKVNELGSPYLHKRKKVGITRIDSSKLGRAIVYDQHIIDQLYLQELINEEQHNACDKYLGMIHASGTFATSFMGNLDKIFTGQYSSASPRSVILIKVQRMLRKECGMEVEKQFWHIMVTSPNKLSKADKKLVKDCSNALLNYWFVNLNSPVTLFQQALSNPI